MWRFLCYWGRALKDSFSLGWLVFGTMSTAMPAIITLIQRHDESLAVVPWVKWVADNQVEIQVILAAIVGVLYIAYAPYKYYVEHETSNASAVSALNRELEGARAEISKLTTRILVVSAGDNVPGSMARNRPANFPAILRHDGSVAQYIKRQVDFFGFVLYNPSAVTIHKCQCNLIRLERDGESEPLFKEFTALPFAPRVPAEDLADTVDIRATSHQPVSLCTITEQSEVLFGSCGQNWRFPEKFSGFFTAPNTYFFTVRITSDDGPTDEVRFALKWTGSREGSTVSKV